MIPRRLMLGAPATLAAPIVPASAGAVLSPDAELIRACARYLELERMMDDPAHPDHATDIQDTPEWAEWEAVSDMIQASEPTTREGCAALASVALLNDAAIQCSPWDADDTLRIARKVLAHLAGSVVLVEERRRTAVVAARREEADQRLAAIEANREAEAARIKAAPLTREEQIAGLRRTLRTLEPHMADMRAELAALEAGA